MSHHVNRFFKSYHKVLSYLSADSFSFNSSEVISSSRKSFEVNASICPKKFRLQKKYVFNLKYLLNVEKLTPDYT